MKIKEHSYDAKEIMNEIRYFGNWIRNTIIQFLAFTILFFTGCNNQQDKTLDNQLPVRKDSIESHFENNTKNYSPVSKELYDEISKMDSIMFAAFNAHDLDNLKTTFSEDLEFYHDKGGLTNFDQTMQNFKSLFDRNQDNGLRRDLVKGSMEVYPIKDYGAVEIGVHKFCHKEMGKDDCGTFKFVHTWKKMGKHWKVSRVISYDH